MTGLAVGDTTSAGFNVFDVSNATTPVEIVNLATNEAQNNPNLMEFVYGGMSTAGPVQIRPFNYSGAQVCFNVMPVQMPNGVSSINMA